MSHSFFSRIFISLEARGSRLVLTRRQQRARCDEGERFRGHMSPAQTSDTAWSVHRGSAAGAMPSIWSCRGARAVLSRAEQHGSQFFLGPGQKVLQMVVHVELDGSTAAEAEAEVSGRTGIRECAFVVPLAPCSVWERPPKLGLSVFQHAPIFAHVRELRHFLASLVLGGL